MEAIKETAKVNGQKAKAKKAQAPKPNGKEKPVVKPMEKPKAQAAQKDNVWNLARNLLAQGKKDEEIEKAALTFLLANTDKEKAFKAWCQRMAARSVWRAHKRDKAGKGK